MLMTFLSRMTNSDERTELKAIFRSVGRVPCTLTSLPVWDLEIKRLGFVVQSVQYCQNLDRMFQFS
jgi:hypothetical protein